MYLPHEICDARILVTVKTYPKPSESYYELVCTAGLLNGEQWVRLYPIPFRYIDGKSQFHKYSWIVTDIIKKTEDFRPESYYPKNGAETIQIDGAISTADKWAMRKKYILKDVYYSMEELIQDARSPMKKSLATLKPKEILDFEIKENDGVWKESWLEKMRQGDLFETDKNGKMRARNPVKKLPYDYYYVFKTEGDKNPRRLKIEDWEIGALYWKSLKACKGNENHANKAVKEKYFYGFTEKNDLYFFLGTTLQFHNRSLNPFIIIGVFYPPIDSRLSLFD